MSDDEPYPPYPGEREPSSDLPPYGSPAPPGGYGYPPPPRDRYPQIHGSFSELPKANQLALWSMITGIAAIPLLCTCGVGFFAGVAAVVMGFVAKNDIERSQGAQSGAGQALAGIILGSTAIGLALLLTIGLFAL